MVGRGDLGWFQETKKMNYDGPPLRFAISSKLMTDISHKYKDCIINENRLRVDNGRFQYISSLERPREPEEEATPTKKKKKAAA
jgi:hypothetical protein